MEDNKQAELAALKSIIADSGADFSEKQGHEEAGFTFWLDGEEVDEPRRWTTAVTCFLRSNTGRYWQWSWDRGNTECQENDYTLYGDPVEVTRHERQVTEVYYEPVE